MNGGTPAIFRAQTDWIVDNIAAAQHRLRVPGSATASRTATPPAQWDSAWYALGAPRGPALTTGLPDGIPYGVTRRQPRPDASGRSGGDRPPDFNQFFGAAHFAGRPYYGGHYGANNDNHFELFSASGLDFITISLEYDASPDAPVLAWAESLLVAYPERWGILVLPQPDRHGQPGTFSTPGQTHLRRAEGQLRTSS